MQVNRIWNSFYKEKMVNKLSVITSFKQQYFLLHSRCFTYSTSDFFLSFPPFPPPLVVFIQAFPSQVYLDNGIYFSRQQELKSYVIMYYNNGLKTIAIISHDSMACLGNSFAGFCMASLNAVAFFWELVRFESPRWSHSHV